MEEIFAKNSMAVLDASRITGTTLTEPRLLTAAQRAMLKSFPNAMFSRDAFIRNVSAYVLSEDCAAGIRDLPGYPDASSMFDYLEHEGLIITSCGFTIIDAMQRLLRKCRVKGIRFKSNPHMVLGTARAVGIRKAFESRFLFWPALLPKHERLLLREIMLVDAPACDDVFFSMTQQYALPPQLLVVLMDNLLAKNCIALSGIAQPGT